MNLSFKEFEQKGWERVADVYHECFGSITPQVALALANGAMIQQNDRVLDVACGPGYVAAMLELFLGAGSDRSRGPYRS